MAEKDDKYREQRRKITSEYKKEREMKCYPPPKYLTMVKAYQKVNEMGTSEVLCIIIKSYFDNMPAAERERIVNLSKNGY